MIQLKVPEKCKDCKCCQMWFGGAMYFKCCSAPDPKNIGVDPESRPDWCVIVSTNEKLKEFEGNPTMETLAKMMAMSFGEIELEET